MARTVITQRRRNSLRPKVFSLSTYLASNQIDCRMMQHKPDYKVSRCLEYRKDSCVGPLASAWWDAVFAEAGASPARNRIGTALPNLFRTLSLTCETTGV
jgi:hypothetical protein